MKCYSFNFVKVLKETRLYEALKVSGEEKISKETMLSIKIMLERAISRMSYNKFRTMNEMELLKEFNDLSEDDFLNYDTMNAYIEADEANTDFMDFDDLNLRLEGKRENLIQNYYPYYDDSKHVFSDYAYDVMVHICDFPCVKENDQYVFREEYYDQIVKNLIEFITNKLKNKRFRHGAKSMIDEIYFTFFEFCNYKYEDIDLLNLKDNFYSYLGNDELFKNPYDEIDTSKFS